MTKNQKILFWLLVAGATLYLLVKPKKPKPVETAGGTYRVKSDFSKEYKIPPTSAGVATFKAGQIIKVLPNPFNNGALTTTINGEEPKFGMAGQIWIELPLDKVEKI